MLLESGKPSGYLAPQFCHVTAGIVAVHSTLARAPNPFNRLIVLRGIERNEEEFETFSLLSTKSLDAFGAVRADVIENQIELAGRIPLEEMLEKQQEFPAAFAVVNLIEKSPCRRCKGAAAQSLWDCASSAGIDFCFFEVLVFTSQPGPDAQRFKSAGGRCPSASADRR